jgi:hypothetical protein
VPWHCRRGALRLRALRLLHQFFRLGAGFQIAVALAHGLHGNALLFLGFLAERFGLGAVLVIDLDQPWVLAPFCRRRWQGR